MMYQPARLTAERSAELRLVAQRDDHPRHPDALSAGVDVHPVGARRLAFHRDRDDGPGSDDADLRGHGASFRRRLGCAVSGRQDRTTLPTDQVWVKSGYVSAFSSSFARFRVPKTSIRNHLPQWLDKPEPHNYPAAESFLALDLRCQDGEEVHRRAEAIEAGEIPFEGHLSRVGAVTARRQQFPCREGPAENTFRRQAVADPAGPGSGAGPRHHRRRVPRLCAVYGFDEDAWIPCRIV